MTAIKIHVKILKNNFKIGLKLSKPKHCILKNPIELIDLLKNPIDPKNPKNIHITLNQISTYCINT